MASCIASSFTGAAVRAGAAQRRPVARRVAVTPRAALEAQRMATPYDGAPPPGCCEGTCCDAENGWADRALPARLPSSACRLQVS